MLFRFLRPVRFLEVKPVESGGGFVVPAEFRKVLEGKAFFEGEVVEIPFIKDIAAAAEPDVKPDCVVDGKGV